MFTAFFYVQNMLNYAYCFYKRNDVYYIEKFLDKRIRWIYNTNYKNVFILLTKFCGCINKKWERRDKQIWLVLNFMG